MCRQQRWWVGTWFIFQWLPQLQCAVVACGGGMACNDGNGSSVWWCTALIPLGDSNDWLFNIQLCMFCARCTWEDKREKQEWKVTTETILDMCNVHCSIFTFYPGHLLQTPVQWPHCGQAELILAQGENSQKSYHIIPMCNRRESFTTPPPGPKSLFISTMAPASGRGFMDI